MRKRGKTGSRLGRIERKCDAIIAELDAMRRRLARSHDIDTLIERLHRSARRMREQCEIERDAAKRMFTPDKT